ncbi:MAG: PAS domain-containing protein [Planctomycetaceae bacterium]|nr:PAS domain-containing protein [Planctomycetaceae bacterium]
MNDLSNQSPLRIVGGLTLILALTAMVLFFSGTSEFWALRSLVASAACSLFLGLYAISTAPARSIVAPAITEQLECAAHLDSGFQRMLNPVLLHDQLSQGWNRIVDELRGSTALAELEERIDEKLHQSSHGRQELILNSLSDGIAVTSLTGEVLLTNSAWNSIFGIDGTANSPRQIEQFLPDNLPEEVLETLQRSAPASFETSHQTSAGMLTFLWTRRPEINEKGESIGQIWTTRDISQQKMAEKTRDDFVSMATHELRTPLANINAYAETLSMADDIDLEQQKKFYNIIQSEATRLSRFIDDLLNVSRMESGSMSIERRETDLTRLLNDVCEKVRPEMDKKELTFKVTLPAKLPTIRIDKDAIAAALVNLLGNAAKYTPESGNVEFRVTTDASTIHFQVQDNGIGIAAADIPRLFEKFYRAQDERIRDINGSGLGLAFTNDVARLHQGRIEITSELDRGSMFDLILPLNKGERA